MKKSMLYLFTLLTILLFTLPVSAAEKSYKEGIFTYTISQKTVTITNAEDTMAVIEIPKTIKGYPVVAIGDGAFGGSTMVEEVILPDTVTTIGDFCFAYSNSLKKVTLSNQLKTISDGAFYHCEGLWTITIPDGVKTIEKNAFGRCSNLTAVTIPASVNHIGENAFPDTENIRLYGKMGSVAFTYAQKNQLAFEEYVTVTLNGKKIAFDQPCITNTEHFRTLVPMRAVLEDLDAVITWDNTFNTAGIDVLDTRILIRPDEPFMMVNGVVHYLSCPAVEFNGRVMVPIRDVMETLGGKVDWKEDTKTVVITLAR